MVVCVSCRVPVARGRQLADSGHRRRQPGSAASAYGLIGYPYMVFVDAQNHVQFRSSGEMPITEFNQHVAALRA
jgi:hypothetical protein